MVKVVGGVDSFIGSRTGSGRGKNPARVSVWLLDGLYFEVRWARDPVASIAWREPFSDSFYRSLEAYLPRQGDCHPESRSVNGVTKASGYTRVAGAGSSLPRPGESGHGSWSAFPIHSAEPS